MCSLQHTNTEALMENRHIPSLLLFLSPPSSCDPDQGLGRWVGSGRERAGIGVPEAVLRRYRAVSVHAPDCPWAATDCPVTDGAFTVCLVLMAMASLATPIPGHL